MPFGESSPTPLRTTWYQQSQTEMRGLSNCLKSCQIEQWLMLQLCLISSHFSVFPSDMLPGSFSDSSLYFSLPFLFFLLEALPSSEPLSFWFTSSQWLPPGWDAGAPCCHPTGPEPLSLEFRVFSALLVHGHTLLENILKLCPNTKCFRCLWCLKFSFSFKLDW